MVKASREEVCGKGLEERGVVKASREEVCGKGQYERDVW